MDFERLRESWQELGTSDPRWAILSEPSRKGGGGDDASFWRSGEHIVEWIVRHLVAVGAVPQRRRALDFGCGIGRLSQALAGWFDQVVGVDLADSMIAQARQCNRHGERVQYVANGAPDLGRFDDASFDFVLTLLVLQHMRPQYAAGYLREFLRVLRPGGILVCQLPIEPLGGGWAAPAEGGAPSTAVKEDPATLAAHTMVLPPCRDLAADEAQWFRIEVHNPGPCAWSARGSDGVELGVRVDRIDGTAVGAPQWLALGEGVPAGGRRTVLVAVRAPAEPGSYVVAAQVCLAREWLPHPRNGTGMGIVVVGPAAAGRSGQPAPPEPVHVEPDGSLPIEVHGLPLAEFRRIVVEAGGTVVDAGLDAWAGHEWVSCHAVVRRRP